MLLIINDTEITLQRGVNADQLSRCIIGHHIFPDVDRGCIIGHYVGQSTDSNWTDLIIDSF